MSASHAHTVRRSSRVPAKVPVRVTSMEPNPQFSEICETLVVSAHGCALRFPIPLDAGSALRLHSRSGRQTTAYVVFCQPLGADGQGFRLGAQLDRPENFWDLEACPDDWRVLEMPASGQQQSLQKLPAHAAGRQSIVSQKAAPARTSREIIDKIEEQLSEDRLRGILARFAQPLQAEVAELREKLAANAKRNRFEVSLGYIPPELEEKLWERLRQDLGTRVLQQTREQSSEILASAKANIEQKIGAAQTEFRHRLAGELHAVEQQAQVLSKELSAATQQHVRVGTEKLQRQALSAGSQLETQSGKLLTSLQEKLANSHAVHHREMEQMQADSAAKASHLQSQVLDLGGRIAGLNESVRRLESDLDEHLENVAGEIVAQAQSQLQNAVALVLKDLQARSSNEVESRLNEICGHLRTIQNRIESSFSGSLKVQADGAVQVIAQQFEEQAQHSTEKWRLALSRDLSAVAKTLGEHLREDCEPNGTPE